MKQVLMTVAIVAIVFTTPIDAAEVVESQINDSAIAYEQAGGQARFMGGASPIANESNLYGNSRNARWREMHVNYVQES